MPANDDLQQSEARYRLLVESVRDYAIFMLDPTGHVLTWNAGAERFKGYTAQEIIGQHFSKFYPPEALARDLPAQELEAASTTGISEDEGWRLRKDGSRFWANVVITALRDPDGQLIGFAKVSRDLTRRRSHEDALRQSEERFRLLVEGVADYAIFMLDTNGKVMTWNVGAERIKGYAAEEIIGRHFSVFYPEEAKDAGWPDYELQEAARDGRFIDEGWRLRQDGTRFWAHVTITAIHDAARRLIGFAKLTQDLTERKRVEAVELEGKLREEMLEAERNARMAAQRAIRIKDEFVATLSHELRTPLSAILGWTQILLRQGTSIDEETRRRAIEVIDRNAHAQVKLIDDLLDVNRIMSGKLRLDLQQIPMRELIAAVVESAMPAAQAKDIRITALLGQRVATVTGDGTRLQQVVWNLLSNAIKFTPAGGQVQVSLQRVNSHIELSVSDTGIGIASSFLPHVFDRFSQRDSSSTRSHGGLGLGLAIAKQLLELHGGSIEASSRGEGQGASFLVQLPLSITQAGDEQPAHPGVAEASAEVIALPRLDGIQIFVVDDEADARELLRRVFADQGARVTTFSSAADVLAALETTSPAVIVSDVGMPQMDGYQLMRELRAREPLAGQIPALALTAFAHEEDRTRVLRAGYQAHLAKPFNVAELLLLVDELIADRPRP